MSYDDALLACRRALVREAAEARRLYVLARNGELTAQGYRKFNIASERELALQKAIAELEKGA